MADVLTAVRSVLANDAGVSALVSTRVYPDIPPQQNATYPCAVVQLVVEESAVQMVGLAGMANSRIQVDCYAVTRLAAAALQDACRLALADYTGTSQSVVIRNTYPKTGFAVYEPPNDSSDLGLYRHSRDYTADYVEAAT